MTRIEETSVRDAIPMETQPGKHPVWLVFLVLVAGLIALNTLLFLVTPDNILVGTAIVEVLLILGGPLLAAKYFGLNYRKTFRLSAPDPMAIAGSFLVGCFFFSLFSYLPEMFLPPEDWLKQMSELMHLQDPEVSLLFLLFVIALIPGFCEEFAFRGYLLSGLEKRHSSVQAIGFSALLFAVFHLSVYRFFPMVLLGGILGWAVWKTGSVWTGVAIHMANNAMAIILGRYEEPLIQRGIDLNEFPLLLFIPCVVLFLAGLLLIHRSGSRVQAPISPGGSS